MHKLLKMKTLNLNKNILCLMGFCLSKDAKNRKRVIAFIKVLFICLSTIFGMIYPCITYIADDVHPALIELNAYFCESFGNATRIDYGTGHELAFIMFLIALYKVHALTESDNLHTGLKVFNSYLMFVRRLQTTYRMEPAGSHGVWSLYDYQFVPFIWGSAQLAVNNPIEPHHFLEDEVIERYKNEYMFIGCIDYIKQVKTGSFAEHSNQLWSISAVESWIKIHSGLVKMFQKELLGKFPVIQHVLFGSLLEFKKIAPGTLLPSARLGMLPPRRAPTATSDSHGIATTLSSTLANK